MLAAHMTAEIDINNLQDVIGCI